MGHAKGPRAECFASEHPLVRCLSGFGWFENSDHAGEARGSSRTAASFHISRPFLQRGLTQAVETAGHLVGRAANSKSAI